MNIYKEAPSYRELIDAVIAQGWTEWCVTYTDEHIVTINFWCREVDKSVDIPDIFE